MWKLLVYENKVQLRRRHPSGAAAALLTIVSREPTAALRALYGMTLT